MAGGVQKVTMCSAPLDVLCDLLPVFEPVEQLVCLDIKDPQEVRLAMLVTTTMAAAHCMTTTACDHNYTCLWQLIRYSWCVYICFLHEITL